MPFVRRYAWAALLVFVPVALVLEWVTPENHIAIFATSVLAILSIAFIAHDGETNWMEGVQLLAVYIILSLGFFFLPG